MPTLSAPRGKRAEQPRRRLSAHDHGQMLTLAGIVLCMAYLLATASGMEVARLEHESLTDPGVGQHLAAWRELRAEFARVAGLHVAPRALADRPR